MRDEWGYYYLGAATFLVTFVLSYVLLGEAAEDQIAAFVVGPALPNIVAALIPLVAIPVAFTIVARVVRVLLADRRSAEPRQEALTEDQVKS